MKLTVKGAPVVGGTPSGPVQNNMDQEEQKRPKKEKKPKASFGASKKKIAKKDTSTAPVQGPGRVDAAGESQMVEESATVQPVVEGKMVSDADAQPREEEYKQSKKRGKLDMSTKRQKPAKPAKPAKQEVVVGEPVEIELDMEELEDNGSLTVSFIILFLLALFVTFAGGFLSGGVVGNLLGGLL